MQYTIDIYMQNLVRIKVKNKAWIFDSKWTPTSFIRINQLIVLPLVSVKCFVTTEVPVVDTIHEWSSLAKQGHSVSHWKLKTDELTIEVNH